jgi:hypothetical protein
MPIINLLIDLCKGLVPGSRKRDIGNRKKETGNESQEPRAGKIINYRPQPLPQAVDRRALKV